MSKQREESLRHERQEAAAEQRREQAQDKADATEAAAEAKEQSAHEKAEAESARIEAARPEGDNRTMFGRMTNATQSVADGPHDTPHDARKEADTAELEKLRSERAEIDARLAELESRHPQLAEAKPKKPRWIVTLEDKSPRPSSLTVEADNHLEAVEEYKRQAGIIDTIHPIRAVAAPDQG